MRRLIILLAALTMFAPLAFYGCSGDDGSQGPQGIQGIQGNDGPPGPGVVSNEACTVCHGQNAEFQIADVHEFNPVTGVQNTLGTATITINSVTFGAPVGDNVPVTIDFTFQAFSADNANITSQIDLLTIAPSTPPLANDNLAFVQFLLAKLTPGTLGDSNEWSGFVVTPEATGSSPFRANRPNGVNGAVFTGDPNTGQYSYRFPDNAVRVSDGYVDNVVMRAGVQFSVGGPLIPGTASNQINSATLNSKVLDLFSPNQKLQNTSDRRPVANAVLDVVSGVGVAPAPGPGYPTKNDVTTAACNNCHDILAIHGGGRRETQFCVICHNPKLENAGTQTASYTNSSLLNLGHKIHSAQKVAFDDEDFSEVAYPQPVQNCLTCHKGTDDFWKTRPTRYACGSCHGDAMFDTGGSHAGRTNATCNIGGCHGGASNLSVTNAHAAKEGAPPTPDNPVLAGTLSYFQYGIDNVTVDNTNTATVTFWIKKDGAFLNLLQGSTDNAVRPAGFTSGPSFLIAHAGEAANPQDYSNWDEPTSTSGTSPAAATGQPKSVAIFASSTAPALQLTTTDNTRFVAKLTGTNSFPPKAKMRAVALQGYFTQTSGGTGLDNVGRHTPAVAFQGVWDTSKSTPVRDAQRRIIVKSGYVDNTGKLVDDTNPAAVANLKPIGCLECHEAFEGHGGNRVNNVQVCVMCHNPQLTTSGRTIWDNVTISTDVTSKFPSGTKPLDYPEVTQNMGEMIHRLHAGLATTGDPAPTSSTAAGLRQRDVRVNNFVIVRNRNTAPSGQPAVYGVYLDSDEVTYPGDLTHCTKCHFGTNPNAPSAGTPINIPGATIQSYKADLPTGVLFTTEKVTSGKTNETLSDIIAARVSFQGHDPSGNPTDLVDSPLVGKCGSCHDGPQEVGHFISTGGADIKATRSLAESKPPTLAPVLASP